MDIQNEENSNNEVLNMVKKF